MLTFSKLLKRKIVFDASGIDNPHEWMWGKSGSTDVYFPVEQIPNIKVSIKNESVIVTLNRSGEISGRITNHKEVLGFEPDWFSDEAAERAYDCYWDIIEEFVLDKYNK